MASDTKAAEHAGPVRLHAELTTKLEAYRATRAFDAEAWVDKKCAMFNDYCAKAGLKAAVVSVSGGVDSAVTLGLIKRASEMEGSPLKRILGVAQPIHSSGWALERAAEACKALGCDMVTVDQSELHTKLSGLVDAAVGVEGGAFAKGQLRSYMRTPVGYYVAQLLSQAGTPCVVMGTGNKDEDGYLLYYCKAGDGVVDVQLIADLHKSEVFKVGAVLGVPASILKAAPSADLWEGHTDEEELGFSYDFVELFTGHYLLLDDAGKAAFAADLGEEAAAQFEAWSKACVAVHKRNAHKLNSPANLNIL
mmetsp:Transcript_107419/g.298761  ORF Transcript_107419/g.298761 Transcript_107419/m.298761 type:complete len:307 (+) Transcript_107419:26-946(+)